MYLFQINDLANLEYKKYKEINIDRNPRAEMLNKWPSDENIR